MRKQGILNPELTWAISRLGHTDTFAIGDCGLPLPDGVKVIDLSLVFGVPSFADVARAILNEVVVETVAIADSTPREIRELLPNVPVRETTHETLKNRLAECRFIVRTGETTPFANAIFRSGVAF